MTSSRPQSVRLGFLDRSILIWVVPGALLALGNLGMLAWALAHKRSSSSGRPGDLMLEIGLALLATLLLTGSVLQAFYSRYRLRQVEAAFAERTTMLETLIADAERADYVEFLFHIGEELKTSLELNELLRRLIARSAEITQAEHGSVLLLDDDAPGGAIYAAVGQANAPLSPELIATALQHGLSGWVIRNRQLAQIADVQQDPRWLRVGEPYDEFRSIILAPLLTDERALGVLCLAHTRPGYFTRTDGVLMSAAASRATAAIPNARLYRIARRYVDQLVALNMIAADISAGFDRQFMLDRLVRETAALLGTDYCAVMLREDNSTAFCIVAAVGISKELRLHSFDPDEGLIGSVCHNCRPLTCIDVLTTQIEISTITSASCIRSVVLVPLLDRKGEVAGIMATGYYRPYQHRDEDVQLLTLLAHQAMIALDNAQLYEALQSSNSQLTKANRLKSEFLAKMSHELRTPLNAIIGFTELTLEGVGGAISSMQAKNLERVLRNGHHLLHLINEILDLARIEAGRTVIECEPFPLREVIQDSVSSVQATLAPRQLVLELHGIERAPIVYIGDANRLRQVLQSLLSNAVKFTPDGGQITVRVDTAEDGEHLLIAVADTGIGIEPELLSKIWEEFWQADSSNRRQQAGTGLGLAIVRRLTELMGGVVSVRSTPGQGSVFQIRLPLPGLPLQPALNDA